MEFEIHGPCDAEGLPVHSSSPKPESSKEGQGQGCVHLPFRLPYTAACLPVPYPESRRFMTEQHHSVFLTILGMLHSLPKSNGFTRVVGSRYLVSSVSSFTAVKAGSGRLLSAMLLFVSFWIKILLVTYSQQGNQSNII